MCNVAGAGSLRTESSTPLALWQAGHLTHIGGRSVETVSRIGSPFVGAVGINQRRLNIGDRHAQRLFRFARPVKSLILE